MKDFQSTLQVEVEGLLKLDYSEGKWGQVRGSEVEWGRVEKSEEEWGEVRWIEVDDFEAAAMVTRS